MEWLYIGADNAIVLDGLRDSATHDYINDATVRFTLYRQMVEDGVMSASSAALSSASAGFVAGDVGKSVIVPGAGAQKSDLRTTISALVSATEVTLAAAASVAVSYARIYASVPNAVSVAMAYMSGSNGKYRGVLPSTISLGEGEIYRLSISVGASSDRDDFRELILGAIYRK